MSKLLGLLDFIPTWVLVLAIVGLSAAWGVEAVRLSSAQVDLAKEQLARANENNDRNRAALRESERVAQLQLDHAQQQQELVDGYTQIISKLEAGRAADLAHADRLRRQFAATAARDRAAAKADPAVCERLADRSEVLGGSLAEGGQLLIETRRALARRDAEVKLLLGIVMNDRALMGPADYSLDSVGKHLLPTAAAPQ